MHSQYRDTTKMVKRFSIDLLNQLNLTSCVLSILPWLFSIQCVCIMLYIVLVFLTHSTESLSRVFFYVHKWSFHLSFLGVFFIGLFRLSLLFFCFHRCLFIIKIFFFACWFPTLSLSHKHNWPNQFLLFTKNYEFNK